MTLKKGTTMPRQIKRFSGALFGLAATAALGFGATQAVAASKPSVPCPPSAQFTCGSQGGCESLCKKYYGVEQGAQCSGGCCYCFQ